jgi:two-component system OmpR family sensor kinase
MGGVGAIARMRRARVWATLRRALARIPLQWRLALASFGLFTLLLAAVGALITVAEEQILLGNQARALHEEAAMTVNGPRTYGLTLAPPASPPPPVGVISDAAALRGALLIRRLSSPTVRAALLAPDGTVIASSDTLPIDQPGFPPLLVPTAVTPDPGVIDDALTKPPDQYTYTLTTNAPPHRQLIILLPLVENQHTVALLQLSTSTAPIDRSVAATRTLLVVGIGVALALAAALTFPLIRAALRPLVAMERASNRIANGALSLRLDVPPTHDEIGRLARSFNSMVAQLEAAFARQKRFVADVSHELRTPLTALGGGLEMLLLGADRGDPEAQRRLIRGMYSEVERMNRLVEDLLTLARLDEGRMALRLEPLDARALLAEVSEQAARLGGSQHITLDAPPGLPRILGDGDRLRQVLLNVVDNALKHTPASGEVALAAWAEGVEGAGNAGAARWVAIAVRDTGVGIAPDALPHVFERFYRTDPARTRASARSGARSGGAGLGLAIAKQLVEAQGGTIAVASAPGQGTTVTLRLPVAHPGTSASQRPPSGRVATPSAPPPALPSSPSTIPPIDAAGIAPHKRA